MARYKKRYTGKIPFEQREYIYTTREAIRSIQCGYGVFFKYMKMQPLTFPTSKAAAWNWITGLGYPAKSHPMTLLTEQRIRYIRKSDKSTRELAKILGICQTRVMQLAHRSLPKEAS